MPETDQWEEELPGWACFDPLHTRDTRSYLEYNEHRVLFCDDVRKARCDVNKSCHHYQPNGTWAAEAMAMDGLRRLRLTKGMTSAQRQNYESAVANICKEECRKHWERCRPVTIIIRGEHA